MTYHSNNTLDYYALSDFRFTFKVILVKFMIYDRGHIRSTLSHIITPLTSLNKWNYFDIPQISSSCHLVLELMPSLVATVEAHCLLDLEGRKGTYVV